MTRYSKSDKGSAPCLDMTPMIDVVFQLLIFFLVAIRQDDILSKLTAARPASPETNATRVDLIEVTLSPQGFAFNGRAMSNAELDRRMEQYSLLSKSASVTIKCTADSAHALLIQALDICSKHGMTNLSIFSL
ncbi:MAG: biopolymer transporter ExbD [Kiritimatiellae bacterium]|nr:biopolymer transporter ExbD [Kiritimatiellia bacterium]